MSLEYAILGFLNYRPYTGYDLKKIFDSSVQHFWPADQSQIYRTLNRLTERGLAKKEKVLQEDRPDRKVYHITETGRVELIQWLSGPPLMSSPRSASLIQVFFAGQLSDQEIRAKFEEYAEMIRTVLHQYDQVPDLLSPFQDEIPSSREHFFWLLTLENGITSMRANLAWIESVIDRIDNGEVPRD